MKLPSLVRRSGRPVLAALLVSAAMLVSGASAARAGALADLLGRNDTRVWSAPFRIDEGVPVEQLDLPERLERLGYRRVHRRPEHAGEYFWGNDVFWIYRRSFRQGGELHDALLFGLRLAEGRGDGDIVGGARADGTDVSLDRLDAAWLEPELLSESLRGDRAVREHVALDDLPEHVWRAVLAAEDHRFFDHVGLDGRSLARAALANVRAGHVTQGGSTITQQLVKNRDLSPKRSLGRKASEALRALALESEFDKEEILEAYLDEVYLGNVDGLAIHGIGTAARVYFSKAARDLSLAEAAALAAMIQAPNSISVARHPEALRERRDWVLGRMRELGWADAGSVQRARAAPPASRPSPPRRPGAIRFLGWVAGRVEDERGRRLERGRGVVVESTLDPRLQALAERAVADHLARLRREHPALRRVALSAALVALDARTGEVLAYVGGDPAAADDRFDRAGAALRPPGSSVKPLGLLEPFESCGSRPPLTPATRVADEAIRIDLPSGPWEPGNYDGVFHGAVTLREALRRSLNVPFVRTTLWCGPDRVAAAMRRAGLDLPDDPPISFSLGAIETTVRDMAGAYTVFPGGGKAATPLPMLRVERPDGWRLERFGPRTRRVVHASTAYVLRDMMRDAVERGTGRQAAIEGIDAAGKTGTGSDRDAWFVGDAGGIVTSVWVGIDRDGSLGLTGGSAAAPLWKRFMEPALSARALREIERPSDVVTRWVDPDTGMLRSRGSRRAEPELFRRGSLPDRHRWFLPDHPSPVIR